MSESISSVQQIQQRLTCPICLERYKQPKLLPCQHTFCLTPCLINLIDLNTNLLKCPECRCIHKIPTTGVESFPNNITLMRFLDLNLTKSSFLRSIKMDKCFQCGKNCDQLGKCLDCERLYCQECRPIHLQQLKNETRNAILNLRKILPKLSSKVNNFEQKKEIATQNYNSIRREITSVIDRLIEDLKNREQCLHAEVEIYLQGQIRTIGLEKENAEIELASVTSFCDSTEQSLNKPDESLDNEIALIKKQCMNFIDQTKDYDEKTMQISKMNLIITDLTDLSNYIKNFGNVTVQNVNKSINLEVFEPENPTISNNDNNETQPQPNRPRQTWNRDVNIEQLSIFSSRTNENDTFTDRTLTEPLQFTSSRPILLPIPKPVAFNVTHTNNRRLETLTHATASTATTNNTDRSTPIRSNTFVLETDNSNTTNNNLELVSSQTRRLETNELSRSRRFRPRTPLTFNVMLNEPNSSVPFDYNDTSAIYSSVAPTMPNINYSSKQRAKLIFGKKGKNNGDLIWPCDVCINQFNNQIVVSDSGNNRVQIFDSNGRFIKKFGTQGNDLGQFDSLSGIFIDTMANIYSTDRLNHRIQIFDRYCRSVRSIGNGPGNLPGQLNYPLGICVNRISEIFVCDKENDRVCVFHSSGKFLRSFGRPGTRDGEFDKPYFIYITRENLILISDSSNHRIQLFDSNGNFQISFGREGSNPGEFKHPRGIAQDNEGFILVADSGNSRIQVFRPTDYTYVTEFGSAGNENGKFMGIEGIRIASNGDIIVCDRENHRIQIF